MTDMHEVGVRSRTEGGTRGAVLQLVHFTWSSGAGLIADLAVFSALVYVGGDAFRANIASASIAITLAYFLVTRFSFRVAPTWRTYAAFIVWYATSATLVSIVIELIAHGDRGVALAVKLCSIPLTFFSNYMFGRWLFNGGAERLLGRSGRTAPRPAVRASLLLSRHPAAVVATVVTVWYQTLIFPITSSIGFSAPSTGDVGGWIRLVGLRVLFAAAMWAVAWFVVRFSAQVRAGSRRHRTWLIATAAVLAVNLGVLLLIYPGLWIWDEFGVLGLTRVYSGYAWQGYLTNIYYALCLYLIPTGVGIVLVQMTFASVVGGYVVSSLREHLGRPRIALLCAVPFLSFATLANNAYPLRLTMYSYVLVLVLTRLVLAWRSPVAVSAASFVGFGFAVSLLAFWRTEGLVFLLLLPAYAMAGRLRLTWRRRRIHTSIAVLATLASLVSVGQVAREGADPHYEVTAFVNPLSTMLQHPLRSPHLAADFAAIDRVIDINALRADPSYLEIPAFWAVGARPGFEQALPAFKAAYVDLVVNNPGLFLENRWQTFIATNSMQPDYLPQIHGGGVGLFSDDPSVNASFATFTATNFFSQPLSASVRSAALKSLLLTTAKQSSAASSVVWNAAPTLVALIGILAWSLRRRRRWVWSVCAVVLLMQAGLIFLTAPGAFFMYYFPAYLAGGLLLTTLVAARIDVALVRRSRTLEPHAQPQPRPRPQAQPFPILEPVDA